MYKETRNKSLWKKGKIPVWTWGLVSVPQWDSETLSDDVKKETSLKMTVSILTSLPVCVYGECLKRRHHWFTEIQSVYDAPQTHSEKSISAPRFYTDTIFQGSFFFFLDWVSWSNGSFYTAIIEFCPVKSRAQYLLKTAHMIWVINFSSQTAARRPRVAQKQPQSGPAI